MLNKKILIAACVYFYIAGSPALAQDGPPTFDAPTQQIARVHKVVSQCVVLVEGYITEREPRPWWQRTGVIVSDDGLVLCCAAPNADSIKVLLPNGNRIEGHITGQSAERNIALVRMEGALHLPHADLKESEKVKPGETVLSYDFRINYANTYISKLLRIEAVDRVVRFNWFGTTGASASMGWRGEVLFDLDGKLLSVGNTKNEDARLYIDPTIIRSVWHELALGKDIDRNRLWPTPGKSEEVRLFTEDITISESAKEHAAVATVRMREANNEKELPWSGVIVDPSGYVATCAHHEKMPGTILSIALGDGRRVSGVILGSNPISDVCLVKIMEQGPWPSVSIGDSRRLQPGCPCFNIGYPNDLPADQPPQIGVGLVIPPSNKMFVPGAYALHAAMSPHTEGGMSGGGVFDPDGNLIAIMGSNNPLDGEMFSRIELLTASWKELSENTFSRLDGNVAIDEAYDKFLTGIDSSSQSIVTIMNGESPVALGTIVSPDYQILTTASTLPSSPSVRLADGSINPAVLIRSSNINDLALLKISAQNSSYRAHLFANKSLTIGELIALPNPSGKSFVGWVSCDSHCIKPVIVADDSNFSHGGFSQAFEAGVNAKVALTGGPVLNGNSEIVGLVAAAASDGFLIIIPSAVVRNWLGD